MRNTSFFVFFIGTLLSLRVHATSFQVMPLDKLVEESSSAAEVTLKDKKSFMNKMGMILTEYSFSVGESYNVEAGDLDGEFLKITMTGGVVNGVTSFIDGAPEFAIGEKSFLLLKKIESKFYISNFTMGKYKILEDDGKIVYVSSVFPNDSDIGQVKKERMIEMIKTKYKITRVPDSDQNSPQSSADVRVNAFVMKDERLDTRSPAQESINNAKDSGSGEAAMWAFFVIFMTSGATIWWKLKKGVSV